MYIYDLFTIYHQELEFYTKIIIKHFIRNSCHVTIPCTYEQVRSECKYSGNCGAEGVALLILVGCCEYSYSPGGASSYLGGNIGGCTTYI